MTSFSWLYNDIVKDHFMNPRNVLQEDENFQADGEGLTGNIQCGDEMLFLIKVDKEKGVITDCRWKTYGCASAIASTSVLSEMVKGMRLEDAYRISPRDVEKQLGGLPEHKIHCSVLGDKALRAAIEDYYRKNGLEHLIPKKEIRVVCQCLNITEEEIENAVLEGARTYIELQEKTKIGTVCGKCKQETILLLDKYIEEHFKNRNR